MLRIRFSLDDNGRSAAPFETRPRLTCCNVAGLIQTTAAQTAVSFSQPPQFFLPLLPVFLNKSLLNDKVAMAKDDPSIPTWQKAPSQPSDTPEHDPEVVAEGLPAMQFTEVDEMPPIPSLEEAKAFLDHPGTKQASPVDKIRFLELKNVQRKDIEALIPEAKSYYIKARACHHLAIIHANNLLGR
jgi:hypothetical protein